MAILKDLTAEKFSELNSSISTLDEGISSVRNELQFCRRETELQKSYSEQLFTRTNDLADCCTDLKDRLDRLDDICNTLTEQIAVYQKCFRTITRNVCFCFLATLIGFIVLIALFILR